VKLAQASACAAHQGYHLFAQVLPVMKVFVAAGVLGTVASTAIPTIKLNTGAELPMVSLGTWQLDSATAETAVKTALQAGFNHIDTANNYNNQDGVGRALKGVDRSSYFLTTKVPPGNAAATAKALQADLDQLGVEYVDLMLVHFPPFGNICGSMQAQWKAMEDFYKAGKAKAIGVSNYCVSSLECIAKTSTVTPAVNQVQFHVGMGSDPAGLKSYGDSKGIVTQAYSPLGDGTSELITGALVTGIGKAHNMTGAQVSLKWLIETGVPLSTKTTKVSHMEQDLAIFGFNLEDTEKSQLDKATSPKGKPSFICNKADTVVV
jgi:2,5-diketo-D-gluconate reductase A